MTANQGDKVVTPVPDWFADVLASTAAPAPTPANARGWGGAPRPRVIGAWLLAVVGACVATLLVAGTVMLVVALFRGPWPT